MSDAQKFEAFKERVVAHNEQTYGTEIRAKYGDEQVDAAHAAEWNIPCSYLLTDSVTVDGTSKSSKKYISFGRFQNLVY